MSTVEDQKWFHRKHEQTFGPLAADHLPPIDWSVRAHLEALFPFYKREQIKAERAGGPKPSKLIEIDGLDLKTPTKDKVLLENTTLTIEPHKHCALYGENGTGNLL
jgi:ABC-type molybdenum transport system ATPase subunit/photorepair protein PhrA